jgi:polyisoprenoid-binding protein YceI
VAETPVNTTHPEPTMKTCLLLAGLMLLAISARAIESTLEIDRTRSHIEVDVKATLNSFTAKLTAYNANLSIDPENNKVALAQVQFRFADLKTGNEDRDTHMREWQSTEQFPEAIYIMKSLEPAAGGKYTARGTFIFHGASRELTFPVTITTDNKLYAIDGEFPLDTREYGLSTIKKYLVAKVNPVVKIRFHLQGSIPSKS